MDGTIAQDTQTSYVISLSNLGVYISFCWWKQYTPNLILGEKICMSVIPFIPPILILWSELWMLFRNWIHKVWKTKYVHNLGNIGNIGKRKKVIFIHMYVISLYPILVLAAIVKDWDVALFFPAVQPGSTFPLQVLSIFKRCLWIILQRNIINTRSVVFLW